jgi:putative ABC transport system permease protein
LASNFPEVLNAVRFQRISDKIFVQYKDKKFFETNIFIADDSVFNVFSFPLISGDPESALKTASGIVITENTAKKYFGNENPIGKVIKLENKYPLTVTGVMKNVPQNSHFSVNILVSFKALIELDPDGYRKRMENWTRGIDNYTYLLLQDNTDYKKLEKKFPILIEKHAGEILSGLGGKMAFFLQPLSNIHLHSKLKSEISENGDVVYVYAFTAVAVFILFIACVNFMNLSTARSAGRTKEVGIRKVLGAHRGKLIYQFLGESILLTIISLIIALGLVEVTLPLFCSLSGSPLSPHLVSVYWLILGLCGLLLFVAILAGSYPALFLSAFQPARVLTGRLNTGLSDTRFRNILVVFQFTISIALIAGTSIIFNQIKYMKQKNLGFDKEQVVVLRVIDDSILKSFSSIKDELKNHTAITKVALSSHVPGQSPSFIVFIPEGFTADQSQLMDYISIDSDFIPTMGIEIIAGRNFSSEFASDNSQAILINATAAKQFNWENPIGKTIDWPIPDTDKMVSKTVIGVAQDFHTESLHKKIRPLYIDNRTARFRYVSLKLKPLTISDTLSFLRKKWKQIDPAQTFDYFFLDEAFDRQYKADEKLSQIFSYFTFLAIFIACLGLFGLASFTAEKRTKEIGIRKILGASVSGIISLLSKEFTKWVLVANIIAWPIAYLAMNRWLQNFAYRINIGLGTFVLAALLALIIALLTVSYQAVRAARSNPVDALRYE